MPQTTALTAANAANKRKALIAGNILLWVFQGLYTVSPIDLIPDLIPVLGWTDDLFGLLVTVAFTVYTVSLVRRHGVGALIPGQEVPAVHKAQVVDVEADDEPTEPRIPGYEPLAIDEIKRL